VPLRPRSKRVQREGQIHFLIKHHNLSGCLRRTESLKELKLQGLGGTKEEGINDRGGHKYCEAATRQPCLTAVRKKLLVLIKAHKGKIEGGDPGGGTRGRDGMERDGPPGETKNPLPAQRKRSSWMIRGTDPEHHSVLSSGGPAGDGEKEWTATRTCAFQEVWREKKKKSIQHNRSRGYGSSEEDLAAGQHLPAAS